MAGTVRDHGRSPGEGWRSVTVLRRPEAAGVEGFDFPSITTPAPLGAVA
jgi:hypothetical protein